MEHILCKDKSKIENGVSYKAARDLPDMTAEELHKEFKDCSLSDAMPSEEQIRHILKSTGKYCCGRRTELRGMRIFYMQGKSGRSLSGKSGIVYVYALCIDTGRVDV